MSSCAIRSRWWPTSQLCGALESQREDQRRYQADWSPTLPFDNLCDGAAEAESRGYLDVENAPPWDTWVAWSASGSDSGLLLAWVPADFVVDVESGIQVNTEQCIHWHPG
ncbi:MAG: hypothetical protein OXR73_09865 [Myxococcales bacterium]|nr:hypothetical protein [Myxococcales bacterium]